MSIWLECKKYLRMYPRLIAGLLSSALTCVLLISGVNTLLDRGRLFEPFTVGVVDNDGTGEIRFVFDFFDDAVTLDYLDKAEAEEKLLQGEIPAYVELPDNFAADVMNGTNTPFVLHGNSEFPLQYALTKLLAAGGIAYLSSAQAGIYATMDYAAARGLSWDFIYGNILYPVNIAFIKQLLEYESFFAPEVLEMTEGGNMAAHYALTFLTFLFMVNLLSFGPALRGYTAAIYARCRLAGWPFILLQCTRLAGLFAVNALWMAPVYAVSAKLTGWGAVSGENGLPLIILNGLALTLCVCAFGLMSAAIFRSEAAFGLFIFVTALAMLFLSGGIVPLNFLPRILHGLRFLCVSYWAGEEVGAGVLILFSALFFGVNCYGEFLRIRFPRPA